MRLFGFEGFMFEVEVLRLALKFSCERRSEFLEDDDDDDYYYYNCCCCCYYYDHHQPMCFLKFSRDGRSN